MWIYLVVGGGGSQCVDWCTRYTLITLVLPPGGKYGNLLFQHLFLLVPYEFILTEIVDRCEFMSSVQQDYEEDPEDEDDDFCPLVIDTQDGETPPSTPSKDKSGHLLHHSKDMDLYRENNPSDTEESSVSVTGTPLKDLEVSLTRCELDTTRDSSSPCSRVSSPTLSITSKSGSGSAKPTQRQSQPNKARKKTDKVCHLPISTNLLIMLSRY